MTVRWITERLGTAAGQAVSGREDVCIVDVRDMVDKAGNRPEAVRAKIDQGAAYLRQKATVVVCCDYGISRSNAVAAGILALYEGISLDEAVRRVQFETGEAEIKLGPLGAVRAALEGAVPAPATSGRSSLILTGGAGFVGGKLISALRDRFEIVSPGREVLDIELGSTDLDLLVGETNAKWIVHLANPRVFTSNVALGKTLTMLHNVIDVCVARGIPLLYLSGWEVYSGYSGDVRADEATPLFPQGPYGETKHLAEIMIESAKQTRGLRCAIIRSSPVYGAGGDRPKFIHTFKERLRQGHPIVTHRYRNGDPALDLLHVDDLVTAIAMTVSAEFLGTLNIGTGITTTTPEIARLMGDLMGNQVTLAHNTIDADAARISMNATKAGDMLDWRPKIELKEGLVRFLSELH